MVDRGVLSKSPSDRVVMPQRLNFFQRPSTTTSLWSGRNAGCGVARDAARRGLKVALVETRCGVRDLLSLLKLIPGACATWSSSGGLVWSCE